MALASAASEAAAAANEIDDVDEFAITPLFPRTASCLTFVGVGMVVPEMPLESLLRA